MIPPRLSAALGSGLCLLAACAGPVLEPVREPAPQPKAAAAGPGAGSSPPANQRLQPLSEDRPVAITSDRLTYLEQGKITVFQGHVSARQDTLRLEAPYLEVRSADNRTHAKNGVRITDSARDITITARELDYQENLLNATASGQVVVDARDDRGQPLRIRSDRLDWNVGKKRMQAQGRVQVTYGGNTATAERMDYQEADQTVVLKPGTAAGSPQPTIMQADNIIRGNLLTLRLRERIYEAQGSAWGNINPRAKEQP